MFAFRGSKHGLSCKWKSLHWNTDNKQRAKANSSPFWSFSNLHPSVLPVFCYLPLVWGLSQLVLIEEGGLCILGPPGHPAGKGYTLLLVSSLSQAHASAWAWRGQRARELPYIIMTRLQKQANETLLLPFRNRLTKHSFFPLSLSPPPSFLSNSGQMKESLQMQGRLPSTL